jgi:hypothetical protein
MPDEKVVSIWLKAENMGAIRGCNTDNTEQMTRTVEVAVTVVVALQVNGGCTYHQLLCKTQIE